MTYLLNVDEAIDRKFLVTKHMKGQVESGNIIHVMDAESAKDGSVTVTYRVARFNGKFHDYQDYTAKFESLASFCKWAQPDNFIARNYEVLDIKDIQHYIKVKNRSFASFCLPIILILAAVIWVLSFVVLKSIVLQMIVGVLLTLVIAFSVFFIFKSQKKQEKLKLYQKISTSWGVVIK